MPEESPRAARILDAAADALLDGRDPFEHSFLLEHRVSLDECGNLSDQLGLLAKAWLRASPELRAMIAVLGATHNTGIDPGALEAMTRGRQAMEALRRLPTSSDRVRSHRERRRGGDG